MSKRLTSSGRSIIAITPPRYATRSEWIDGLIEVAQEVPWIDPRCRVASALAPVAQWAARSRSEAALRRVALEIAKHGPEWDALRPLGLRARAVLGAEPSDRDDAGQTRAGA